MTSPGQVEENVRLAGEALPNSLGAEELAVYEEVLERFNASCKIRCTGCNYCMPCPRGVNIPGCFAGYNSSFSTGWVEGMKQYVTSTTPMLETPGGAGLCEKRCPQQLPIMENLALVQRRMEPLWFRLFMSLLRKGLGKAS